MIRVKKFWPFILILVVVLVFFFPVFKGQIPFPGDLLANQTPYSAEPLLGFAPNTYPNKAQGPDVINEIYPWRYFSINTLKNGDIPFWNPHNFSGNPQLANFQTAVFYPLNILYFALPFNLSWTLIIMLQPLLAGFFMYLFLRKAIGLKDFASVIGAIAFGFSSYMSVWIEYGNIGSTIMWLPLVLLFTKYYFGKANVFNFLGICLSIVFAILAGYIQGVFYIYVLSFLYYSYLVFGEKGNLKKHKKNFLFLVSLALPILITAFQILPTLQIFAQSTRGAYSLDRIQKNLSPLFNLITVAIPDYFGNPATRNYWIDGTYIERVMYPGTLILFFAILTIVSKINLIEKKFFAVVAFASLILATNFPLVKYLYLIPIPVISTTIATRELSIFIFSTVVLGAMGIEYFLEKKEINKKFILIYAGVFVLIWILTLVASKTVPSLSIDLKISMRNLILPTILLVLTVFSLFLKKYNLKFFKTLILLLLILDLFYFFYKITPFSPTQLIYPQTSIINYLQKTAGINRFWGYGSAYVPPNFQSVDSTYSPEGNDPLHLARYGELLASSNTGKIPVVLPRPDANVAGGYGSQDLKTNYYRKRILDLLGVKYILNKVDLVSAWYNSDENTFPANDYALVKKIYPWQVYENKNAVPRIFLTGKYILAKNKSQSLSFIYNSGIDLKNTLILEESPKLPISSNAKGTVKLITYKPNSVIIKTESSENTLLFISDNYFSQWNAKIDITPTKVLIADYSFRAVEVPKGEHTVEFFYNPKSFTFGLGIGVFGLILLFFVLYYVKNNEKAL